MKVGKRQEVNLSQLRAPIPLPDAFQLGACLRASGACQAGHDRHAALPCLPFPLQTFFAAGHDTTASLVRMTSCMVRILLASLALPCHGKEQGAGPQCVLH